MEMSAVCYPCFASQILEIAEKFNLDVDESRQLFADLFEVITSVPVTCPSPVIAMKIRDYIYENISERDIYLEEKQRGNLVAMEFVEILQKKIDEADDPLLQAAKIAILGNIIDVGVPSDEDVASRLEPFLQKEEELIANTAKEFFEYERFKEDFYKAKKILYIADNTGEIVLDSLFIKTMKELRPELEIVCATRDKPILNDATIEDAIFAGIDKYAEVISSGCSAPGTIFEYCSDEFLSHVESADLIISKGQGNFETLTNEKLDLYFMLMIKCDVIADYVGCEMNNLLLKKYELK